MAERKVTLRVFGMTCDDCVRTVSNGLKREGADVLSVSLNDGMAIVKIDDAKISAEKLVKAPVFGEKSHYKAQLRKVE
ncbi:MAG: cation transporter [Candidatus Thermoplasmatota archaeon]|jgi:copper chaperone CopZ|nr:cation transporter [Candidatus Thermoplasmatota archaeon]MCL5800832.1 cation transporter [Candidatus Thermoplasmatota archaeon]